MESAYKVGILVISDTVSKGEKEDRSGINLEQILLSGKHSVEVRKDCVPDDRNAIQAALENWSSGEVNHCDLILTVGGTGFSPRDVTPEVTRAVIDRETPYVASYMILKCSEVTPFAVLSRSICGIRDRTLILNLPGSTKGAQECYEAVAQVLPHALDQLRGDAGKIVADHVKIQGGVDDRTPVAP